MLKKENIYIDLRGKSKEELTELYWLLKNNNEKLYRDSLDLFLEYPSEYKILTFDTKNWCGHDDYMIRNKQEATIQQLKEILQPMENKGKQLIKEAKERGFLTEGNEFYSCFDDKNELRIIKPYDSDSEINLYLDSNGYLRYYDGLNNEYNERLCSNPAIYKDGVWAEIKNNNLTLTEQLKKAKAEVERLKAEINKIKIGDWCLRYDGCIFKATENDLNWARNHSEKITDKELINKLNELIK